MVKVFYDNEKHFNKAKELSLLINSEVVSIKNDNDLYLSVSDNGLSLEKGALSLQADFNDMLNRLSKGNLANELLVKASKVKEYNSRVAIDMTAGFGTDSLLLAASGYHVVMIEHNIIIYLLLVDALERALKNPKLSSIVSNMEVVNGNSIDIITKINTIPDIVYLDPMFPERNKSSQIKKKFQLLHELETPSNDVMEMIDVARSVHPKKVILKRPLKDKSLDSLKPSYSISGKAIRYDCFINN